MLSRNWRHLCRRYSQAVNFRTSETSPWHLCTVRLGNSQSMTTLEYMFVSQHNDKQIGQFYTLQPDLCKQLFGQGGFPKSFMKQTKTFTETTIMVRQPALDIMECIKATDFEKPVIRYVIN
ncbi:hypothetical protein MSG28_010671 [Choristoneura fumiferana]|uniref:Uncharacterized protein n=1 Tax=Choristoneura fumiferana TaxID=7141 RepID=A0ACC0KNY6_CHOFU|nr:hypothetical protein MSG28_010671 [Choristoneura fumiferana]